MERKVTIKVNGKKIPINKFVHQITQNIILSIVDALHDTDSSGTIEITVEEQTSTQPSGHTRKA